MSRKFFEECLWLWLGMFIAIDLVYIQPSPWITIPIMTLAMWCADRSGQMAARRKTDRKPEGE